MRLSREDRDISAWNYKELWRPTVVQSNEHVEESWRAQRFRFGTEHPL